jgi:DNA-binding NarL/FixJ family response regulator
VLVVDDFQPFHRFIRSVLQDRPELQVICDVFDGLAAVEKARELQPDLILLDIGLPHLNGIEVARRVRNLAPHAKILFLSQDASPDVVREALSQGALGYVHKPRAQTDLLPAIKAVLAGRRFLGRGLEFSEETDTHAAHRHEILFCSDDAAVVDGLTRFIAAALRVGNPALVLATKSHQDTLLQTLHAQGVDIAAAIQRGTYVSLDADEPPDPVRFVEATRGLTEAASKAGKRHPRVAFCGERAGRLWAAGKAGEVVQLERLCEELAKSQDVDVLCAYPLPHSHVDDEVFKRICAEHTAVNGLGY